MLNAPGGWNHKLLTYFGASTAPDHLQSQPSAVLDDMALSRGFMTANSSMNVNGQNTNQNVSAEALMMLKEHTIDHQNQPERSVVDAHTAAVAYRAGQVTDAHQLATVPIIDLRAYSETGEIHTSFYSYKMRARLDQANGGHGDQLIWTFPATEPVIGVTPPQDIVVRSFLLMDRWLSNIEADHSGRTQA